MIVSRRLLTFTMYKMRTILMAALNALVVGMGNFLLKSTADDCPVLHPLCHMRIVQPLSEGTIANVHFNNDAEERPY